MTDCATGKAAAEFRAERGADRQEKARALGRDYRNALIAAQTSHDPWDWLAAGAAFKRYVKALVLADIGGEDREARASRTSHPKPSSTAAKVAP